MGTTHVTAAKRHHFVPQFYLERFAISGQVFVRRREGRPFVSSCLNVAVESGFYDYGMPDGTKSKAIEERLGKCETATASVLRSLDDTMTAPPRGSSDRDVLCEYLGLQMTRTPEERERTMFPELVARFLAGRELTRELMAQYLESDYLGFKPKPREVDGAFSYAYVALRSGFPFNPELVMDVMFESLEKVVPRLDALYWTIEEDRKSRLISSDSPLVLWRAPSIRDSYEGYGLDDCEEIRFPISPRAQLVLSKKQRPPKVRITPERSASCNADTALTCHNFVVSSPRDRTRVEALHLRSKRPVQRFDLGPLIKEYPDGTRETSEVIHMWVPRR